MKSEQDIKRIREILEILFKKEISKELEKLSEDEKKIYELTGEKGQSEIVKLLKIAPNTVSKVWKELELKGLLVKEGRSYRKVI